MTIELNWPEIYLLMSHHSTPYCLRFLLTIYHQSHEVFSTHGQIRFLLLPMIALRFGFTICVKQP